MEGAEPGAAPCQAQRSLKDPDLFLIHETWADEADVEGQASRLDALLQLAVEQGLAAAPADDRVEVELYRTL